MATREQIEHEQKMARIERLGAKADSLGLTHKDFSQDVRIRIAAAFEALEWRIGCLEEEFSQRPRYGGRP